MAEDAYPVFYMFVFLFLIFLLGFPSSSLSTLACCIA